MAEPPSEPSGESAPDLYAGSVGKAALGGNGQGRRGIVLQAEAPVTAIGKGPIPYDSRKFRYDMYRASATKVAFAVSRDDRMSAEEAGQKLNELHVMFGIEREEEHILKAFDDALFFYHTLNSASVLQPGRGKVWILNRPFDMAEVNTKLGIDSRRFYRAFADEIKEVNRAVLADYDPYDHVKAEKHGWLMQVALERGIHRYPYLAHDSADACVDIKIAERIAISNSKRMVIGSTINAVDRADANSRVNSARGYDSTSNEVKEN